MGKRKEPMHPTGFWFLSQFFSNFLWCLFLPFWKRPGAVDILLIDVQARIVRVKRRHHVITTHRCFPHKFNVCCVDLVDVQAAVLAAKSLLPLSLIAVSHHIYDLITAGCVKQDMWNFIVLRSVAVVLSQDPEVVNDSQILIDDVLFGGACVLGRDDV